MKELLAAARILAAIHTGAIEGLGCNDCNSDIKEDLNCHMADRDSDVFQEDDLELYLGACPLRYITSEAIQYYDELQFYKLFSTVPYDYKSISYRRWEFFKEYDLCLKKFEVLMIKKRPSVGTGSTEDNLASLRSQFLGKNKSK